MEYPKENIVKTAFDVYCNKLYNKEYPLTVNNLKIFFNDIEPDFKLFLAIDTEHKYFNFPDDTLKYLIKNGDGLNNTNHSNYLHHFINTYSIPF